VNEREAIERLDGPDWAPAAAWLLKDLGFSLVNSDHPGLRGGSNLLVAFRPRPTLRHFDPEAISYWVVRDGHGRVATWQPGDPDGDREVLWGSVRILDRLAVENRFLGFGGTLRIARVEAGATVLALRSSGPIVRWGGHSQGADQLAGAIGAFFARLMVPVDFEPGAELRVAGTPPRILYAAFIRDARARLSGRSRRSGADPRFDGWLLGESSRLAHQDADALAAGAALLVELGLARG
jgi:hypothetical protein